MHDLRRLVNVHTLMLFLILGAALPAGFFLLRLDDERNARLQIDSSVAQARVTLDSLRLEEATLTQRAAELPSSAAAAGLPSREEAFRLGETFTTYVAEQRLALSAFASVRMGSTLGGKDASAVSHTLEIGGPAGTLIRMLDLAREIPSSIVRSLEFQRDGGSHDQWVMSMTVIVFYDEPERQS